MVKKTLKAFGYVLGLYFTWVLVMVVHGIITVSIPSHIRAVDEKRAQAAAANTVKTSEPR